MNRTHDIAKIMQDAELIAQAKRLHEQSVTLTDRATRVKALQAMFLPNNA